MLDELRGFRRGRRLSDIAAQLGTSERTVRRDLADLRSAGFEIESVTIEGRAWSGQAPVTRVELSQDGGASWADAVLGPPVSDYAWRGWTYDWEAAAGDHELCVRATDAAGHVQPDEQRWNLEGVQNNSIQRITVVVDAVRDSQPPADSSR